MVERASAVNRAAKRRFGAGGFGLDEAVITLECSLKGLGSRLG
jgi:hypothetical protein